MTLKFSILQFLFAFEGRINRAKYWAFFGLSVIYALLFAALSEALTAAVAAAEAPNAVVAMEILDAAVHLALGAPYIVANLAIRAKRWHDRDKSGWWILLEFVPLIGPIWALVECGCLKGTEGENRYGPDPLAPSLESVFE